MENCSYLEKYTFKWEKNLDLASLIFHTKNLYFMKNSKIEVLKWKKHIDIFKINQEYKNFLQFYIKLL